MKYFELKLPPQYTEVAHVRFNDVKTELLYDLKAVLPGILLTIIGWIIVKPTISQTLIALGIFALSIHPYFSLHEIVHGIVIKVMTGQRVEIGFNKSGAYCGMPDLYMYRPLAVGHWMFLTLGLMLALHLLGCQSDVNLLKELGKHKDDALLVKDAGTEQRFYASQNEETEKTNDSIS